MNQRVWSNEEKVTIVLEMLRGDEPMVVICNRHGVSAAQAYRRLDRFLERGRKGRCGGVRD
jgi:transposase-like protein